MTDPTTPPADRAALRDRIRRVLCEADGHGALWGTDMLEPDEYGETADAVLAVLLAPDPTVAADRAAVLTEAADAIDGETQALKDAEVLEQEKFRPCRDASAQLRRMAAEAERPLSPYFEHPECGFHWHGRDGMDVPLRDGQPVCPRCELLRLAAETQEPEPTENPARIDRLRPEFTDCASIEAIDAQLQRSRAQERRWHLRTEWLIGLRETRAEADRG
nr:hypothetical protein [Streptomyces acidiscabies]